LLPFHKIRFAPFSNEFNRSPLVGCLHPSVFSFGSKFAGEVNPQIGVVAQDVYVRRRVVLTIDDDIETRYRIDPRGHVAIVTQTLGLLQGGR
jgi:hypothetical protein